MIQPLEACQGRLGSAPTMADLTGRMMFEQGRPGRGGVIPVEFLGLRLVVGGQPDPSGSVFDVVVDPTINGSTAPLMLRAAMPVRLTAMTPGFLETRFESMQPVVFVLPAAPGTTNGGTPCVELRRMTCVPVNPSAAIKRELIQLERKLDRLLKFVEAPPACDTTPCP